MCVCPSVLSLSPSPLSICVLWAANLVENGVVFPPVSSCQPVFMSDCVVLDFFFNFSVSLPPSNLCHRSNCQGCSERIWRLRREVGVVVVVFWGGGHPSSAAGPGTQDQRLSANSLTEKIPGEASSSNSSSSSGARGVSLSLSLPSSVYLPLSLSHCLHTVFM